MFVTTRDQVRRRDRVYTNSKAARSSKISIFSAFTVATSRSGGSNSTITQESYNRSQKPKRRRPRDHRSRRSSEDNNPPVDDPSVDVFDFLIEEKAKSTESLSIAEDEADNQSQASEDETDNESQASEDEADNQSQASEDEADNESQASEDEADNQGQVSEDEADNESQASEGETPTAKAQPIAHTDESDPEGYYRSMSDSGISMGSSSSAYSHPQQHHLPVLPEEPSGWLPSRPPQGTELALVDPRWAWPNPSPQPYPDGYIPPPCPPPPPAVVYDVPVNQYPPYTPYGTPPPMPTEEIRRPAITVREPTDRHVKPRCFRSFSKVSTRLILQMQDEIADLEEELKLLDEEADAAEEDSESDSPQSRHGKQEHKAREDEIYGELHVKLDDYCKLSWCTLCSV